jgi:hypothetical protein
MPSIYTGTIPITTEAVAYLTFGDKEEREYVLG